MGGPQLTAGPPGSGELGLTHGPSMGGGVGMTDGSAGPI
jgi:hypothetical protein